MARIRIGSSSRRGQPTTMVGKVGQSLFFLVFLGMGLFFLVMLVGAALGWVQSESGLTILLFLPLPLIFVAIGAWGIREVWVPAEEKAVSVRSGTTGGGRWALPLFGLVFTAAGGAATWFIMLGPLMQIQAAQDWERTPCLILSSEVESHSDSDGTTYRAAIEYRYEYNGQTYTSDRYGFFNGSSSGYEGKARVVRRYPAGAEAACWVNPENPSEAVIEREWTNDMLGGLIGVVFMVVGLGITAVGLRKAIRWEEPKVVGLPTVERAWAGEEVIFSTGRSTAKKLLGALLFVAFWNGVVSLMVFQALKGWRAGDADIVLTLFAITFTLVGLGAIGAVVYYLLALTNPRVVVRLSSEMVPLGGTVTLNWEVRGAVHRLTKLRFYLEGREEAKYESGDDTKTAQEIFTGIDAAVVEDPWTMAHGYTEVRVPADVMHSFESTHHKIVWEMKVHGEIAMWPDVKAERQITIVPREIAR